MLHGYGLISLIFVQEVVFPTIHFTRLTFPVQVHLYIWLLNLCGNNYITTLWIYGPLGSSCMYILAFFSMYNFLFLRSSLISGVLHIIMSCLFLVLWELILLLLCGGRFDFICFHQANFTFLVGQVWTVCWTAPVLYKLSLCTYTTHSQGYHSYFSYITYWHFFSQYKKNPLEYGRILWNIQIIWVQTLRAFWRDY